MFRRNQLIPFLRILSNGIGLVIIGVVAITYISNTIVGAFIDVIKVGLSAIGILAALSAICFSYASSIQSVDEKWAPLYAGEKFLHSCILIVQAAMLSFAYEYFGKVSWFIQLKLISTIVLQVIQLVNVLVIVSSFYCAYWGFEKINEQLWQRWEARVQRMHRNKDK